MVGIGPIDGNGAVLGCAGLFAGAIGTTLHDKGRIYAFAVWIVAGVVTAVWFPQPFLEIQLPGLEKPLSGIKQVSWLISVAMFGMGATLTLEDFKRVLVMPKGVLLGSVLQFSVMPLLGWSIANGMGFDPEIATGIILVGCAPGGVSSNVITYLAKGNVALSVTMTACTTMAAPLMTPLMMFLLAGKSVPVNYLDMMQSIAWTVVGPVVLGIVFNGLAGRAGWRSPRLESILAILSIAAIFWICAIIAANSHQAIREMGAKLLVAVLLHNLLGYTLGYLGARSVGLNEIDARTVAIEVGLQNGGMAANLATTVLKNANAAIAPAIFAPVMNVSGSLLATWWSQRPTGIESSAVTPNPESDIDLGKRGSRVE